MDTSTQCRKCTNSVLRYEENQWGSFQVCMVCGWELMLTRVSEQREDAIVRHQLHTGQREGIGVRKAGGGLAIPADLKRRINGGSEAEMIADAGQGLTR